MHTNGNNLVVCGEKSIILNFDYFLIFNIIIGEKIKKIKMNNIHFVCDIEKKKKIIK